MTAVRVHPETAESIKAAVLHVEIWRSKEASNRAEGRATQ